MIVCEFNLCISTFHYYHGHISLKSLHFYLFLRHRKCTLPPSAVAAPATSTPRCSSLTQGFHSTALRLQDESKSDKSSSSSSTSYHEHYQAHPADQDTTAASHGASADDPSTADASRANTRYDLIV